MNLGAKTGLLMGSWAVGEEDEIIVANPRPDHPRRGVGYPDAEPDGQGDYHGAPRRRGFRGGCERGAEPYPSGGVIQGIFHGNP